MNTQERDNAVLHAVREAARESRNPTVSEVVAATGVARASVYRVARKLGYSSWMDFTNSILRSMEERTAQDPVTESVEAVARALRRNRELPVLVDAVGDAEICASYLLYRLAERGYLPLPYSDALANVRGRDTGAGLALVINESGMTRLPACLMAKASGFEVVTITSSHDTPVSKVSSINVVIKNNKSPLEAYQPNYFAAGTLAFLEYVLRELRRDELRGEA